MKPKSFTVFFISASLLTSGLTIALQKPVKGADGCGQKHHLSYLAPNNPGADFLPACNHHDDCYDTFGTPKQVCDRNFHEEMLSICRRTYHLWINRPFRGACNKVADAYYTAVMEHGSDAYRDAQNAASDKLRQNQNAALDGLRQNNYTITTNLGDGRLFTYYRESGTGRLTYPQGYRDYTGFRTGWTQVVAVKQGMLLFHEGSSGHTEIYNVDSSGSLQLLHQYEWHNNLTFTPLGNDLVRISDVHGSFVYMVHNDGHFSDAPSQYQGR